MSFYKKLSPSQAFLNDFVYKHRTGFSETLIFVEHFSLTVPLNFEKAALYFVYYSFCEFGKFIGTLMQI